SALPGSALDSAAIPGDGMVDDQHHDGTHDSNNQAVGIEARHRGCPECGKDEPADNGTDDPEDNVHKEAFACLVDDLASDEPSDQTQHNPSNNRHAHSPLT